MELKELISGVKYLREGVWNNLFMTLTRKKSVSAFQPRQL